MFHFLKSSRFGDTRFSPDSDNMRTKKKKFSAEVHKDAAMPGGFEHGLKSTTTASPSGRMD